MLQCILAASLYVAGVDDYGYGADVRRAVRGIPRDAAIVLLAHNPRIISLASRQGVSLVLAVIPTEAKLTCRFLELFTAAPRSVCDTRLGGPAGDDTNLCQPGNWHDRVAVAVTLPGRDFLASQFT